MGGKRPWGSLATRYGIIRLDWVMKKPLNLANQGPSFGAGEMNRTPDLLITNELLYRLSYTGFFFEFSLQL